MKSIRPRSVTVAAWFLLISAALALAMSVASHGNPETAALMEQSLLPVPVQYVLSYGGLGLQIVCALAILKGLAWGRLLYAVWGSIGLSIGLFTSPVKLALIPGAVIFAIIVFLLFRSAANIYFAKGAGASV
ncbi:hypothetical protein M4R22_19885 [Acidovorax sp. GBBC 3334]|uniref:hypothetical protein n=1 Tax=Acidovorax sp. GBBC 3334 TaxID=2940496 RepID=UPI0023045C69|nr:hypothetical protein [Acidovorax sp. GBBC 3334]MDA8457025.1 hypothetical protein [Acidovorax sp. GBBC 3334]